jgi:hypothetical protein
LEQQDCQDLAFLFSDHGAKIVSNFKYPASFGNAIITIEAGNLRLRVIRDRRDLLVDVAPIHSPGERADFIQMALMTLDMGTERLSKPSWETLQDLAQLLEPKYNALQEAYSISGYPATKRNLQVVHHDRRSEWTNR